MVQGGVHDAGVGALIPIRHVLDGQSVCINHEPESITALEARRRFPCDAHSVLPLPLIVWQLSAVLEPGHGGDESRVVFDGTLEGGAHSSLDHPVLWLLQYTSRF